MTSKPVHTGKVIATELVTRKALTFVVFATLSLSACNDRKPEQIAWGQRCLATGFNADQCGILLEIAKESGAARASALSSSALSGTAVGIAVGTMGAKR